MVKETLRVISLQTNPNSVSIPSRGSGKGDTKIQDTEGMSKEIVSIPSRGSGKGDHAISGLLLPVTVSIPSRGSGKGDYIFTTKL